MKFENLQSIINLPIGENDTLSICKALWANRDPEHEGEVRKLLRSVLLRVGDQAITNDLMNSYTGSFKDIRESYLYFKSQAPLDGKDSYAKAEFLRGELGFDKRDLTPLYFDAVQEGDPRGYFEACIAILGSLKYTPEERCELIEGNFLKSVEPARRHYIGALMKKILGDEEGYVQECKEGAEEDDYDCAYLIADYYYAKKDYKSCLPFAKKGRLSRNPDGIWLLAETMLDERFGEVNLKRGKDFLFIASISGSNGAAYELATYLLQNKFGKGINVPDAIGFLTMSANNGNPEAALALYKIYSGGYEMDLPKEKIAGYVDEGKAKEALELYGELKDKEEHPEESREKVDDPVDVMLVGEDLKRLLIAYYKKFNCAPPVGVEMSGEDLKRAIDTNTPIKDPAEEAHAA